MRSYDANFRIIMVNAAVNNKNSESAAKNVGVTFMFEDGKH